MTLKNEFRFRFLSTQILKPFRFSGKFPFRQIYVLLKKLKKRKLFRPFKNIPFFSRTKLGISHLAKSEPLERVRQREKSQNRQQDFLKSIFLNTSGEKKVHLLF